MTDKLEDTSLRLKDEMDLYRTIMDKLWHNRHAFQKEKESMQEVRGKLRVGGGRRRRRSPLDRLKQSFSPQLIDDLRRELEYLQCFKLEMEHPGKGKGLSEHNARTREMEMEHEVRRLKQVGSAAPREPRGFPARSRSFLRLIGQPRRTSSCGTRTTT